MKSCRFAGVFGVVCLFAAANPAPAAVEDPDTRPTGVASTPDGATILRVFLADGTSLVNYGELARVGDRVVFSMATSASLDSLALHLVNLAVDRVDWARTERYSDSTGAAMTTSLDRLSRLKAPLDDTKTLKGSSSSALASVQRAATQILKTLSAIEPPDESRAAHALFVSAAQLADGAAHIRREAALAGDIRSAWNALSAAAGALMLEARARAELLNLLRFPQLLP